AYGPIRLLVRSENAHEVLVVSGGDDEGVVREPGFLHDPIDLGLAGKVRYVELAPADRLDIGQRGPDKVLDTGVLGGTHRRRRLLELAGAFFARIGHQKDAIGAFER